ncbi:MAG: ribonuclease H-like domain-containing protein [Planctomycetota bacterium]|jgi:predicted PolB exonuclease-like 3'-5' exonuclease
MEQPRPQLLEDLSQVDPGKRGWFTCYAMLRTWHERRTRDDKPFVDVEVSDQTATIRGNIWEDAPQAMDAVRDLDPGNPVKLLFQVTTYQGAPQLTIRGVRVVTDEDAEGYRPEVVYGEGIELCEDLICETLVFDIETVPATDKRQLPTTVAEALGKFADRKEMDTHAAMGLSPFFGKVVSLALGEGEVDVDEQQVTVLLVPPPDYEDKDYPDWVRPMSEAELLRAFWVLANAATTVVSFNGRGFDVPFLVTRSLVHEIPARVDLLSNRFALRPHLDLYQVMTQGRYGGGPSNLDTICWALGVESPKGEMDGSMVAPAYEKGDALDIATYNRADVTATTKVYHRVRDLVLRYRKDW